MNPPRAPENKGVIALLLYIFHFTKIDKVNDLLTRGFCRVMRPIFLPGSVRQIP